MQTILFVCTGNTCRSSMAEALFKSMLAEQGRENEYEIISAGVAAYDGQRANENAILALKEVGVELKNHQTTRLKQDLLEKADLILTMTEKHKRLIWRNFDKVREKVYTLKEYSSREDNNEVDYNISDPFGQPLKSYKESAMEIKKELENLLGKLD